ncbi:MULTISPECIES: ABC transporter ATP-binding protein [unclassified Wolbachia]|uniref:ABC transporter ATP-binding protein n=1 Tax=unclassified Wolbachia TaxID=2640676 RepID=UPI001105AEFE|nr:MULTISPECIES: ATP-binding cassette domain-containing protein [unclassified Wolbachia]QVU15864.1 ABC transporter, ATP-binding protein [Wolbachia endosymbiont of Drosophila yakuba]QVU16967.1 ABC transporter, ATP-binding protein [Wolbachia endosymbiont of Drosophila santomea]QWE32583.1 ABC transporter, ATP-binding protein [Wolbachia endosymbiont of Drosophila simulans]TLW83872.1 ATP-binding cassette domain-containing protein [Wolbachia endosymbiont of Drosophila teissieri]TLW88491.1 ATP-bindin
MRNPIISILNLSLSFDDRTVLKDLNFDILKGESLVILGGSGSGKSVLTKTIIGLLAPDSGSVKINSKSKNKFGVLFQNSALFDYVTVWENISFNYKKRFNISKKEAKQLAIEKLNDVGLEESIADMFPIELSGGMKKRVALAMAIAHNPEIIILDEPTSGLDPIMSDIVNEIIIKLSRDLNPTIITITHDIHSAFKIADKIAVLYEGEIISHGTVQEIQNTNNEYIKKFIIYS